MRCRTRRGSNLGLIITSFSVGMIVAMCCPKGVIIALMSAALIVLGIALCGK